MVSVRGDDAVSVLQIPSPNLLKIDVDGLELHILKGMRQALENPLLRAAIIEVEKDKTEEPVINEMSKAGFEKISDSSSTTNLPVFNVVFSRK